MAADRSRLAAALAYEEERRRRMMESVPGLVTTPALPTPRADFRTNLENLSIGLGEGLTNQLKGIKGIVTDPVGTAKGVYEAGRAVIRDPSVIADALRYTAQKATSGPLGAGEVIGEMLGPRKGGPMMQELDVYHGTPHRFPATEANPLGEFDASKIGTGEGAQAYGHGVYLAESPGVAESYKKVLTDKKSADLWTDELRQQLPQSLTKKEFERFSDLNAKLSKNGNLSSQEMEEWRKFKNLQQEYDDAVGRLQPRGSLYKADLPDEMIGRMLDWDKPLSEQPALVKQLEASGFLKQAPAPFSNRYVGPTGTLIDLDSPGGNLVMGGGWNQKTSTALRNAGIPGIKYLDAGSRGQGGSGTRNFVVFPGEEKKIRILERDGQKAPPQKIAQALEAAPDYRMTHRPMSDAGGASRLHNAYESFGEDIYGPKALQYFGAGDPREAKVVTALKRLRDNPDAEVTVYRGVPKDATGEIGKGDWVTLDRSVAAEYGDKVLTKKVKAKDITTWPDSLLEFGYYPEN